MRKLIMTLLGVIISLAGSWAQDNATDSMTATCLNLTVTNGTPPFAATGSYLWLTSPVGTNYTVLGRAGAGLGSGTYKYVKMDANSSVLSVSNVQSGTGISVLLSFASADAGTFLIAGLDGAQSGAFTRAHYLAISQPELFLSGMTNGQFQTYLSGQNGFEYEIETSPDLADWSDWTNVAVDDLTTNFNFVGGGRSLFFRAKIQTASFAPDSLADRTFNLTIAGGVPPLPTNGICQWRAGTNDNSYQIFAGPGTANSSGTYVYTKTGPVSGLISYSDSEAGNVNEQLVFTSPEGGYFYATNATGEESGTFALASGAVLFLGNIHYTSDTNRSSLLYFPADGSSATISVTNAEGWIWTLYCPTDALLYPQAITMTPFASVDAGNSVLPVSEGVQLGPDGIHFCDAVTLTVTPPAALGLHASFMLAADDGSELSFVGTTNHTGSYTTKLWHFTSATMTDPSDPQWRSFQDQHLAQIQAAYDHALAEVNALNHRNVEPPVPPDYSPICDPASPDEGLFDFAFNAYETALFRKEFNATRGLLGAAQALSLATGDVSQSDDAVAAVRELIETDLFRTVDKLFMHYSGNVRKQRAVTQIALDILHQDYSLGGNGHSEWLDEIVSWLERDKDYYFGELRNAHDYSLVSFLFDLQRQITLLGGQVNDEQFLSDLADAWRFKLSLDITFTVSGAGANDDVEAKGDVLLNPDPASNFMLKGSGLIHYVSGTSSGDGETVTLVSGQAFTVNAQVTSFDACDGMLVTIVLDRFGAASESWTDGEYDVPIDPGLLESGCSKVFADRLVSGAYAFTLTLRNKNAQAVNQTAEESFSTPDGVYDARVQFGLEHTPK